MSPKLNYHLIIVNVQIVFFLNLIKPSKTLIFCGLFCDNITTFEY